MQISILIHFIVQFVDQTLVPEANRNGFMDLTVITKQKVSSLRRYFSLVCRIIHSIIHYHEYNCFIREARPLLTKLLHCLA